MLFHPFSCSPLQPDRAAIRTHRHEPEGAIEHCLPCILILFPIQRHAQNDDLTTCIQRLRLRVSTAYTVVMPCDMATLYIFTPRKHNKSQGKNDADQNA